MSARDDFHLFIDNEAEVSRGGDESDDDEDEDEELSESLQPARLISPY